MRDILNGAQEFIQKQFETTIDNDEKCIRLNNEILTLEKEILPLLPAEAKEKFLKIDSLSTKLINRICVLHTDNFTINR